MSCFRSRAPTLGAGSGLTLLLLACGSSPSTPFYDALPQMSAKGSGGANPGAAGSAGGSGLVMSNGGVGGNGAGAGGTTPFSAGGGDSAGMSALGGASGTSGGSSASGSGSVTPSEGGDEASGGAAGGGGAAGSDGGAPHVDCSAHGATATDFDAHCYRYQADTVTWNDAVDACQAENAHLVTISSDGRAVAEFLAENSFVWQLGGRMPSWLGATDGKGPHQKGDGTYFHWITGEPMTLDNWSSGQPNNASTSCDAEPCSCDEGACYEHCGFLWDTPGKQMDSVPGWNDRLCDHRLGFVCEWDE